MSLAAVGCGGRPEERAVADGDSVDGAFVPGSAQLTGVVTAVASDVPGPGTVLHVMITEDSFSGTGYTRIATQVFDVAGQAWPIPFAIAYEPADVDAAKRYVVWASLIVGQRTLLEQDRFVRVLTKGAPAELIVVPLVDPGKKSQLLPDASESAVPDGR